MVDGHLLAGLAMISVQLRNEAVLSQLERLLYGQCLGAWPNKLPVSFSTFLVYISNAKSLLQASLI